MGKRVKVFFSSSLYQLEQEINEYLENNKNLIGHIKQFEIKAISEFFFYAYILYYINSDVN